MSEVIAPPSPVDAEPAGGDLLTDALKVPPHSVQGEQSVLGGLMLDNQAWDQVADRVSEKDFYRREPQLIFRAIGLLAEHSKPFDVVTLSEELERHSALEQVGGLAYLGALAKDTPSAANILRTPKTTAVRPPSSNPATKMTSK